MLKPPKLHPGDKVAVVSPSWGGPGAIPHRYQAGKQQLETEFGVTVVEMPHALADPAWIARNPQARAADLMAAFADPSIRAIIASIGGEDSIRTLPYTDLKVIRANPKIFMGYSDTLITHFACLKAGVVSFYGPAIMAGFGENGGLFPYMVDSVRRTLFSAAPTTIRSCPLCMGATPPPAAHTARASEATALACRVCHPPRQSARGRSGAQESGRSRA